MRSIAELIPDVSIAASGAPKVLILHALGRSLSQFLYQSEAWKEWSLPIDSDEIVDGEYTWLNHLDPDDVGAAAFDYLRVKRIQMIKYGATTIEPILPSKLAAIDPEWQTTSGSPRAFVSGPDEGGTARFYPTESASVPVVEMSARLVMVTEATTGLGTGLSSLIPEIPERLFREYRETIVHGALAILYMIPGKDWTQFSLGSQMGAAFSDAVVRAASKAARDHNNVQVSTAFNPDW